MAGTPFTSHFGPPTWQVLFFTTIQYYLNQEFTREEMIDHIRNMLRAIPCLYCRRDSLNTLEALGGTAKYIDVQKPFYLAKMIYDMKHHVNMKLHKLGNEPSFRQVLDTYLQYNPKYDSEMKYILDTLYD